MRREIMLFTYYYLMYLSLAFAVEGLAIYFFFNFWDSLQTIQIQTNLESHIEAVNSAYKKLY